MIKTFTKKLSDFYVRPLGLLLVIFFAGTADAEPVKRDILLIQNEEHAPGTITQIRPLSGGSFLAFGSLRGNGQAGGLYLAKLNNAGRKVWHQALRRENLIVPKFFTETKDGVLVVSDVLSNDARDKDVWLIRVDQNGNILWQKDLGGVTWDEINAGTALDDGGFVLAGSRLGGPQSASFGWILKIDDDGKVLWEKSFGRRNDNSFANVTELKNGNYAVSGTTYSAVQSSSKAWLLVARPTGEIKTDKTVGKYGIHAGQALVELENGFIFETTVQNVTRGNQTVTLYRIDRDGRILNRKSLFADDRNFQKSIFHVVPTGRQYDLKNNRLVLSLFISDQSHSRKCSAIVIVNPDNLNTKIHVFNPRDFAFVSVMAWKTASRVLLSGYGAANQGRTPPLRVSWFDIGRLQKKARHNEINCPTS